MKRTTMMAIVALISLAASSTAFAQSSPKGPEMGRGGQAGRGLETMPRGELVKIEGKLAVINSLIAVQTKDKTYYVTGFEHLIGFIDGLKEGATVKVEGEAMALPLAPEYLRMRATKLTFNGRDFDLPARPMMGRGHEGALPGMGGMDCPRDDDEDAPSRR